MTLKLLLPYQIQPQKQSKMPISLQNLNHKLSTSIYYRLDSLIESRLWVPEVLPLRYRCVEILIRIFNMKIIEMNSNTWTRQAFQINALVAQSVITVTKNSSSLLAVRTWNDIDMRNHHISTPWMSWSADAMTCESVGYVTWIQISILATLGLVKGERPSVKW